MPTGTGKWFSDAKGFGYITSSDGEDLVVLNRDIVGEGFRSLTEGARVTFDVEGPQSQARPQLRKAVNVKAL